MKKWPGNNNEVWEQLRQLAFLRAAEFARRFPSLKRSSIAAMGEAVGLLRRRDHRDNNALPAGVDLRLFEMVFVELYFTEDFARLANGLEGLLRAYGHTGRSPFFEDIGEEIEKRQSTAGGWLRIGTLDTPSGYVELTLHFVGPSTWCLMLKLTPVLALREQFSKLIALPQRSEPRLRVKRLFGRPQWYVTSDMARHVRLRQIERFFLRENRNIVRLLRKYIGTGWAMEGPLPTIEILTSSTRSEHTLDKAHEGFWEGLGLSSYESRYQRDGIMLFHFQRSILQDSLCSWRRILLFPETVLANRSLQGYADRETALAAITNEMISYYAVLRAIEEHVGKLMREVASLRADLAEPLGTIATRRMLSGRAKSHIGRLAFLRFERRRLEAEVEFTVEGVRRLTGGCLADFSRYTFETIDAGDLLNDSSRSVSATTKHLGEQLDLLNEIYQDRLNFTAQLSAYTIARASVILTFVATVAAILSLFATWLSIPEPTRMSIKAACRQLFLPFIH